MAEEVKVSRGGNDRREALKAQVTARFEAALQEAETRLELAEAPAPDRWEIFAFGPWQDPEDMPGRIIFLGQKAYIAVVVWMNPPMCRDVNRYEAKIELNFWTSNTQTMQPVRAMNYSCCIQRKPGDPCYKVMVWEFEPTEAACVLETNICARICNCQNHPVGGYAGFVRHVFDFDPEALFAPPPPGWGFDRPIRYMVSDDSDCNCSVVCP